MDSESTGSVSHWLEGIRAGESMAAQELWNRYFDELTRIAQARLRSLSGEASGEDVALSAMKSVMIGAREGRYPDLTDRHSLWPLLVTITARKSITQQRRQLAKKRSVADQVPLGEVENYIGSNPSPEFALEVADTLEKLVTKFDDPTLRLITQRKLEGLSHEKIAEEIGCSKRTVIRKLNRVRQEWEEADQESRMDKGLSNDG